MTADLGLRELAPLVLGALVRKFGDFDACEDAVQEALLAASVQWPEQGVPDNPRSWLITVASRRRIELLRSDTARQRREVTVAAMEQVEPTSPSGVDDTLTLFQLCCHPALTEASQVALTLRAVGGLTTAEIARAYLVPEATVAQRISRAKQRIKAAGSEFRAQGDIEAVLKVLYLVFNEGYTASSGESLHRVELTAEAIRLARQLPSGGEVTGLLALMLLTDARRPARSLPDGTLVPLADQDRARWDRAMIDEGVALISSTLSTAPLGPYQVQAAIAAVHCEAGTARDTDWPQILALYDVLHRIAPGPMVTLNRLVALAMVRGPAEALDGLAAVRSSEPALDGHHRVHAVRAHLLDLAGDTRAARAEYELAAKRTLSLPEQRYLRSRAARLA